MNTCGFIFNFFFTVVRSVARLFVEIANHGIVRDKYAIIGLVEFN